MFSDEFCCHRVPLFVSFDNGKVNEVKGCFKFFSNNVGFVAKRSFFAVHSYVDLLSLCEKKLLPNLSGFVVCLENPKLFVSYVHGRTGYMSYRCVGGFVNDLLGQKVV